ncbi:MAG TPA: hypothetical protein VGM47_01900 [Gammaproteobacteria bacterium]
MDWFHKDEITILWFLAAIVLGLPYLFAYLLTLYAITPWYQKNRLEDDPERLSWEQRRDRIRKKGLVRKMGTMIIASGLVIVMLYCLKT